jgi:hypothetical protein
MTIRSRQVTSHPGLQSLVEALSEKLDMNRVLDESPVPEVADDIQDEHRDA